MLQALSELGREGARIVLHATCVACGGELPWRDRTASCCSDCWSRLPRITTPNCDSCAEPLAVAGRCIACSDDPLPVDWTDAWGHYRGTLEQVLHAFKFERHDFFADALAELLHDTMRERADFAFDAVVPVPMHKAKLRRRGYNQAELLARALAKRIGVRCLPALLAKRAERDTQSLLPRAARRANVKSVFAASPKAESRSILIVDDVTTTGETLRAAARVLLGAGARRVAAIVVAKTE
jgi:ComF family protein